MKPAASPDELARDPIDRYWLGETQIVWCRDAITCGSMHWGTPTVRDAKDLTRALDLSRHPALAAGFEVFMDTSGIERVEWTAFSHLFGYVRERLAEWGQRIRRQAVVVPTGPAGPLLAGMVPLIGMTYPMRFFSARDVAIDWLWASRGDAVAAATEAARLAEQARGLTPTVQRLRAWLDGALVHPTLEAAARAIHVSPRTLQRELQAASTRFSAEVQAARVRAASAMLAETDEKIDVIARAVGCVSASQLSALFRRHVGDTPARYRERLAAARSGATPKN
jgi:AraC-like DNA-binding protein